MINPEIDAALRRHGLEKSGLGEQMRRRSSPVLRGVALRDVYRDANGDLWEVIGLCDEPQATFRRVRDDAQVQHVIDCPNMRTQFPNGPMRESPS